MKSRPLPANHGKSTPSQTFLQYKVAAPGENTKEVTDGAALGLDEAR